MLSSQSDRDVSLQARLNAGAYSYVAVDPARTIGPALGEIRAYLETRPELAARLGTEPSRSACRRNKRCLRATAKTGARRVWRIADPYSSKSWPSSVVSGNGPILALPTTDLDENPGDSASPGSVRLPCHSRRHITRPWWSRGAQTSRPATPSGMHARSLCAPRSPAAAIQGPLVPTPMMRA